MFHVNRVTLLGNATRDPEVRSTRAGKPMALIGLATNRSWKDSNGDVQREPEFHRLVCWGSLAEFAGKRVKKGSPLYVEGRLRTSRYADAKAEMKTVTEIEIDRLVLLASRKTGETEAAGNE